MQKVTIRVNTIRGWVLNGEQTVGFGTKDAKGREIGATVKLYTSTNTPRNQEYSCLSKSDAKRLTAELLPAGFVYGYVPQATRNGKDYGPLQRPRFFASREARDADVRRYFKQADARAHGADVTATLLRGPGDPPMKRIIDFTPGEARALLHRLESGTIGDAIDNPEAELRCAAMAVTLKSRQPFVCLYEGGIAQARRELDLAILEDCIEGSTWVAVHDTGDHTPQATSAAYRCLQRAANKIARAFDKPPFYFEVPRA